MHNYHLIMANTNMPLAEYFPFEEPITDGNGLYWYIMGGEPLAEHGYLKLPDKPGFGLELNQKELQKITCSG
jgi:L-alanine-DL-glutamate epimerase-like enolase superfamily enzyme